MSSIVAVQDLLSERVSPENSRRDDYEREIGLSGDDGKGGQGQWETVLGQAARAGPLAEADSGKFAGLQVWSGLAGLGNHAGAHCSLPPEFASARVPKCQGSVIWRGPRDTGTLIASEIGSNVMYRRIRECQNSQLPHSASTGQSILFFPPSVLSRVWKRNPFLLLCLTSLCGYHLFDRERLGATQFALSMFTR